jgi:hypothetical protein
MASNSRISSVRSSMTMLTADELEDLVTDTLMHDFKNAMDVKPRRSYFISYPPSFVGKFIFRSMPDWIGFAPSFLQRILLLI